MTNDLSAEKIRALLKLEPHATCGIVRITFISATNELHPADSQHHFSTAGPRARLCIFMVTPDAPVRLHRIRNDQLYHRYLGDPIEVLILRENGASERAIVGPDIRAGQSVQLLIPGNTFHTARVIGQRRWFLGASTEWPGMEKVDVEAAMSKRWRGNTQTRPTIYARFKENNGHLSRFRGAQAASLLVSAACRDRVISMRFQSYLRKDVAGRVAGNYRLAACAPQKRELNVWAPTT